jgi:hypothetical protein
MLVKTVFAYRRGAATASANLSPHQPPAFSARELSRDFALKRGAELRFFAYRRGFGLHLMGAPGSDGLREHTRGMS